MDPVSSPLQLSGFQTIPAEPGAICESEFSQLQDSVPSSIPTFKRSMASSPPGVDMILSCILDTDVKPTWLLREQEDGDAVRDPMEAVEKLPGRWFSEASKYLCLLFWKSFRSERETHRQREGRRRGKRETGRGKEREKREGRKEGRKDQCKRKAFKQQQGKFCNF